MIYTIVVDINPSSNPSSSKKTYNIDIEELRYKGNVYDTLVVNRNEVYVMRKLELSPYYVLSVKETPVREDLSDVNIELFEGENYIYIQDMTGNTISAEYIIKNDFTEAYVTDVKMNSAIKIAKEEIELSVSTTLQGYSTTTEMNAAINTKANEINLSVNNKFTSYSTTEEMNAAINAKADEINVQVGKKVGENEVISKINLTPETATINAR